MNFEGLTLGLGLIYKWTSLFLPQGNNPIQMILTMAKMAIEKKDLSTVFLKQVA